MSQIVKMEIWFFWKLWITSFIINKYFIGFICVFFTVNKNFLISDFVPAVWTWWNQKIADKVIVQKSIQRTQSFQTNDRRPGVPLSMAAHEKGCALCSTAGRKAGLGLLSYNHFQVESYNPPFGGFNQEMVRLHYNF